MYNDTTSGLTDPNPWHVPKTNFSLHSRTGYTARQHYSFCKFTKEQQIHYNTLGAKSIQVQVVWQFKCIHVSRQTSSWSEYVQIATFPINRTSVSSIFEQKSRLTFRGVGVEHTTHHAYNVLDYASTSTGFYQRDCCWFLVELHVVQADIINMVGYMLTQWLGRRFLLIFFPTHTKKLLTLNAG